VTVGLFLEKRRKDVEDHTGKELGHLKVLELAPRMPFDKHTRWKVLCRACNSEILVRASHIVDGTIRSCGCVRYEGTSDAHQKRLPPAEAGFQSLWNVYRQKIRWRKRKVALHISKATFRVLVTSDCFYCKVPPALVKYGQAKINGVKSDYGKFWYNGLDRVDNEGHYTVVNTVPCCWVCNRAKMVQTLKSFSEYHQRIREIALGRTYSDPEQVLKEWQAAHQILIEDLKKTESHA